MRFSRKGGATKGARRKKGVVGSVSKSPIAKKSKIVSNVSPASPPSSESGQAAGAGAPIVSLVKSKSKDTKAARRKRPLNVYPETGPAAQCSAASSKSGPAAKGSPASSKSGVAAKGSPVSSKSKQARKGKGASLLRKLIDKKSGKLAQSSNKATAGKGPKSGSTTRAGTPPPRTQAAPARATTPPPRATTPPPRATTPPVASSSRRAREPTPSTPSSPELGPRPPSPAFSSLKMAKLALKTTESSKASETCGGGDMAMAPDERSGQSAWRSSRKKTVLRPKPSEEYPLLDDVREFDAAHGSSSMLCAKSGKGQQRSTGGKGQPGAMKPRAKSGKGKPRAKSGKGKPRAKSGKGKPCAKSGKGKPRAKSGKGKQRAKSGEGDEDDSGDESDQDDGVDDVDGEGDVDADGNLLIKRKKPAKWHKVTDGALNKRSQKNQWPLYQRKHGPKTKPDKKTSRVGRFDNRLSAFDDTCSADAWGAPPPLLLPQAAPVAALVAAPAAAPVAALVAARVAARVAAPPSSVRAPVSTAPRALTALEQEVLLMYPRSSSPVAGPSSSSGAGPSSSAGAGPSSSSGAGPSSSAAAGDSELTELEKMVMRMYPRAPDVRDGKEAQGQTFVMKGLRNQKPGEVEVSSDDESDEDEGKDKDKDYEKSDGDSEQ